MPLLHVLQTAPEPHLVSGMLSTGMAHKGTSVVLYRWPSLRQHQYTAITDWTGGLYISPGFAGSRSVRDLHVTKTVSTVYVKVAAWSQSHGHCHSQTDHRFMLPCDATPVLLQGALIATAWTALMHLGEQGYLDHTARIMQVRLNLTDCAPSGYECSAASC